MKINIRPQKQEIEQEEKQKENPLKEYKRPINKCLRCGYVWKSYSENPKVCPRCKSYQWQTPRIR